MHTLLASLPGLSAGHITMLVFGDETRNYFLVMGQAVDDVRLAQNMAQMNDVILSPNCWQLCDRSMIEIERIPDRRAVKVGEMLLLQRVLSSVPGPRQEGHGEGRFREAPGRDAQVGSVWVRPTRLSSRRLLWEGLRLASSRENV